MIVKDEATLQQAMELTKLGPVSYNDNCMYLSTIEPEELRAKLAQRLRMDDIGIVALRGPQYPMEDYDYALKMVKKERRMAEQKAIRHWVTTHPAQVRKVVERAEKAAKAAELSLV